MTFDHSGLDLSTGERSYNLASLVKDTKDLIDVRDAVIGGWSLAAIVAQMHVAMFGVRVRHAVLISMPELRRACRMGIDTGS